MDTRLPVAGWWFRGLALLFALSWLLSSDPCQASSSYPKRIKARWAVTGTLPGGGQDGCLLCHSKEAGGLNTSIEPFAVTLRTKYNLGGADDDALLVALDKSKQNADDSDRDGFSDYDEIAVHGTDPNEAADRPTPPSGTGGAPSGTGGAGAGGDPGAAGAPLGAGGVPGTSGAPGAAGSPDEPEPEVCTAAQQIFPTPEYGCQIGAGRFAGVPFGGALLIAGCLLARRGRARRHRSVSAVARGSSSRLQR